MRLFATLIFISAIAVGCGSENGPAATDAQSAEAAQPTGSAWVHESVADFDRREGFLTLFADEQGGRVYAVFPAANEDGVSLRAIYAAGLTSGLGSNPIGLDRGLFDGGSLIAFRKIGNRLIAEQENWNYQASSENPLERKAVRESFARSFLWAGEITATGPNGDSLVDISTFLTRDALGIVKTLQDHPDGGAFSVAGDRTFPDAATALAFPDNVEFDAFLTLASDSPGREVRATSADGRAVTMVMHHSLVRLPDEGYTPRPYDIRSGAIDIPYYDFSAPLDDQIITTVARRFRLERVDPNAESGPVKEPIVFYVDAGAPPQIRDALIDGAMWWGDAFEAAGFEDAFRVEPLPEGAHPRDIRYNIISWTHRQTRGWSYGGGVSDPRTGEMIKGSVILGSQRVRQDRMIFEGLVGAQNSGAGGADDPVTIALARIRQLSAHEVGHALGFAHNFAASSNDRASVMDYPAPLVTIDANGALDLSNAYDSGIGAWDILSTQWLYSQFPQGTDEQSELDQILAEGYGAGLRYIADSNGRSVGSAHPYASVWDNGEDAVAMLRETMNVRAVALDNFSDDALAAGRPLSDLRQVIVPIYLYHRYQVDAAAKLIGGYEFSYRIKDDTLPESTLVPDGQQRAALDALLETLDVDALTLSPDLTDLMTPGMGGFGGASGGEVFAAKTRPMFDLASAAEAAASITMRALLHPSRAARLVEQHRRDPSRLDFDGLLNALDSAVFAAVSSPDQLPLAQVVQDCFVSSLIALSLNTNASPVVRAKTDAKLRGISNRLEPSLFSAQQVRTHNAWLRGRIEAHLGRPAAPAPAAAPQADIPQGSPIGTATTEPCWHCEGLGD